MSCNLVRLITDTVSIIDTTPLKSALHNPDAVFNEAPHTVSCITAVRYLIEMSLSRSFPLMSSVPLQNLPHTLMST